MLYKLKVSIIASVSIIIMIRKICFVFLFLLDAAFWPTIDSHLKSQTYSMKYQFFISSLFISVMVWFIRTLLTLKKDYWLPTRMLYMFHSEKVFQILIRYFANTFARVVGGILKIIFPLKFQKTDIKPRGTLLC